MQIVSGSDKTWYVDCKWLQFVLILFLIGDHHVSFIPRAKLNFPTRYFVAANFMYMFYKELMTRLWAGNRVE